MKFVSTRGNGGRLSFLEAVAEGLAPDGGLFVPEEMPDISGLLKLESDIELKSRLKNTYITSVFELIEYLDNAVVG